MTSKTRELWNLRFTHESSSVDVLSSVSFPDREEAYAAFGSLEGVEGCLILETCNRVETYLTAGPDFRGWSQVAETWRDLTDCGKRLFDERLETSSGEEAEEHLFRLAAGLESMAVGEEQIVGQIRESIARARESGFLSDELELTFKSALNAGAKARRLSGIDTGKTTLGSLAASKLEEEMSTLEGRRVLLVGAGEAARQVVRALGHNGCDIEILNRSRENAEELASEFGAEVHSLTSLPSRLSSCDAVVTALDADGYAIDREVLVEARKNGGSEKRLVVMDMSEKRNVAPTVGSMPHVDLHTLDDLTRVAQENREKRLERTEKAEEVVEKALEHHRAMKARYEREPFLDEIYREAEAMREEELEKALSMLGDLDEEETEVVEQLTRVIVKRLLHRPAKRLREAYMKDEEGFIEVAEELLEVDEEYQDSA